ncbi:MAG: ABC transporter permease [Vicinamibacteraceae bacterium]
MREWANDLRPRLASLRLSPAREASIIDELSQHLEDRRDELIAGGADPDTATALTRAELERAGLLTSRLGALSQARWQPTPTPGLPTRHALGGLWQDLRYAWRTLRRDPLFTVIAVLTLTFGIGLNTSMFGFMNALIFRPLPFAEPAQLMRLYRTTAEQASGGFSPADYLALRQAEEGVGRFAAYRPSNVALVDAARTTEWIDVSAHLFDVLGIQPAHGRSLRPDDEVPGHERVVLISTALWQDQFGGATDVVGRTIQTTGGPYEIVGVLPPEASDHRLFGRVGVFSPLSSAEAAGVYRTTHTLTILGRRRTSVTQGQADAFVAGLGARMAADFPAENAKTAWRSQALPDSNTGPTGRALLAMLLGLSSCVLLIACSNLANVLLARAIDRSREFSIRTALGASRLQLIRTVVLESLLLAAAGGAGAVLVALWTTRWLQSVVVDGGGPAIPVDWRVLAFAAAVSLATVFFCAVGPALFTRRIAPGDALKRGGRGNTAARGHVRARSVLLVGQFAMAMILVAGASFFLRGTAQMLSQHYGWRADGVAQAEISLPEERYAADREILDFQRRAITRLERIPGVAAVSLSYGLPYKGLRGTAHFVGDGSGDGLALTAKINGISPAYFDVTGTRLASGRLFTTADSSTSSKVAIISEGMARRLFPDGRALGRRIAWADAQPRTWMEIVGVVEDVRSIDLAQEAEPFQLYQPTAQDPRRTMILAVRSNGGTPAATVAAIRSAVVELDASLVARRLMTATDTMADVTTSMSLISHLLIAFAALGVFLAALGIYGAMARMVAQRTDEIGLRMALGAKVRDIVGMVLGSGARVVATGMGVGLAGAFGLSQALGAVLPSMARDTGVAGSIAIAALTAVAVLACYLPARRAIAVDPMVALRNE